MEDHIIPKPEPEIPPEPPKPDYTAHGRELFFAAAMAVISILMTNFVLYGGFHLAFALTAAASIGCSWLYLRKSGRSFGWYEKALLILSLFIAGGFGRSDDSFVKFVMLLFLFTAVNLAFGIAAGQNRRDPNGAASLLDAPRVFYRLGVGSLGRTNRGIVAGFKQGGESTRRIGAVGTGLLVSVPILMVMIFLLMKADAAFEGLMDLLPEVELHEYIQSAFWGLCLTWILYSRAVALIRRPKEERAVKTFAGLNPLTVNTVLIMVCLMYTVYLFSQLAYLSGGLSGILPEEYTLAEYARRGFFEMAWLCAINLGLICGILWLIRCDGKLPLLTRIAGTFIGGITIFFVITASAKMFLYIGSYGLTRLRVLTEVIMLWLAITTVLITIRLFVRIPYMKAVVLTAMVLGALVFWVDVNSFVAGYNMRAYRSGALETIDVSHMGQLGAPGAEYLVELTEDKDPLVAEMARDLLLRKNFEIEDFRDWNYDSARAANILSEFRAEENRQVQDFLAGQLGIRFGGQAILDRYHTLESQEGKRFLRLKFTEEEAQELEKALIDAEWQELPLDKVLNTVLTGNNELFREFSVAYSVPNTCEGWWLFRDLHPEADTDAGLHQRGDYHFILAWYDSQARRLYYLDINTLEVKNA